MKHFSQAEFVCSHSGENRMDSDFLNLLDIVREECGFPLRVTSGYRSPSHPIEAAKPTPGVHSDGRAVDLYVPSSGHRMKLIEVALSNGIRRIGIAKTFVHLDTCPDRPQDVVWVYP